MDIGRKLDLSVYYYIKDVFSDAPFINVVDGFPETEFNLPTIAVELDNIDTYVLELGNHERGKIRTWFIDVFAKDKSQRDEYAYRLISRLEDNIPVYNYDEGFPPSSTPSLLGAISTDRINMQIVKVIPDLTDMLYYRAVVTFTGEYNSM